MSHAELAGGVRNCLDVRTDGTSTVGRAELAGGVRN